jgi:hypothetical protein
MPTTNRSKSAAMRLNAAYRYHGERQNLIADHLVCRMPRAVNR